ncbi:MAG: GC-type dockerin domain-anchored protein [Planctomycetota bacterium]
MLISIRGGDVEIERCTFRNDVLAPAVPGDTDSGVVAIDAEFDAEETIGLRVHDSTFTAVAAQFSPAIRSNRGSNGGMLTALEVTESRFLGDPSAASNPTAASMSVLARHPELQDALIEGCQFRNVTPFGPLSWYALDAADTGRPAPELLISNCEFGPRSDIGPSQITLVGGTPQLENCSFVGIATPAVSPLLSLSGRGAIVRDTSFTDIDLGSRGNLIEFTYTFPSTIEELGSLLLEDADFIRINGTSGNGIGGQLVGPSGLSTPYIAIDGVRVEGVSTNGTLFAALGYDVRDLTVRGSLLGGVFEATRADSSEFENSFESIELSGIGTHPNANGAPVFRTSPGGGSARFSRMRVRDYTHSPSGNSFFAAIFLNGETVLIEDTLFHETSGPLFSPNFSDDAAFTLDRVTIVDHGGPLALGEDLELEVRSSVLDGASLSVAGPVNYTDSLLASEPGPNATLVNSVVGPISFADRSGPDKIPATGDEDLSLAPGPPGIDLASYGPLSGVRTDLAGDPRFVDGNSDGLFAPDAGAFEAQRSEITDCPADVSSDLAFGIPDGQVTAADLGFFVESWLAGVPGADLTTEASNAGDESFGEPDGRVTITDLTFFVEIWLIGCP